MMKKIILALLMLCIMAVPTFAWYDYEYDKKRDLTAVPSTDMLLYVNGSGGWDGNLIPYNPSNCVGNISLYYKSTNNSDFKVVCNDAIDMTTPTLPTGLVAFWDMASTDEYTGNHDLNHSYGDPAFVSSCAVGDCVDFDGDDIWGLEISDDFSFGYGTWTFMFWHKANSRPPHNTAPTFFSCGDATYPNTEEYWIGFGEASWFLPDDGNLKLVGNFDDDDSYTDWSSTNSFENYLGVGDWNLLTYTFNGTDQIFYGNNTAIGTRANSDYVNCSPNAEPLFCSWYSKALGLCDSSLDEFQIYKGRELSQAEVGYFYDNTKPSPTNSLLGAEQNCPPVWYCTDLQNECPATKVKECYAVEDAQSCGVVFTGNLADYNEACGYDNQYTSEDLRNQSVDFIGSTAWNILQYTTLIVLFVMLFVLMNSLKKAGGRMK